MPLQRRLLSVASRLERGSIGKRHLHQAIPALPPSSVSRHLHGRAPQSGRPLLSPRSRRFATSPLHCEKAAQGATGPTSSTQSSSTSSPPFSEPSPPSTTIYTYEDIVALTESPDQNRILIDVREPSELTSTGRIPTSLNIPIQSSPDFAHLPPTQFEDRFGFPRPSAGQEVVFYCKSGVRSRAAARLARQAEFGGRVGEFPGSWGEWSRKGGKVEGGGS